MPVRPANASSTRPSAASSSDGYAALSVREIAKDAGVNHALINYHFRSKDQLVIEVLDAVNRRLLARQASMYRAAAASRRSGRHARRFYEDDLASGFVRMQAELWAASLSNPELREKFLPRLLAWKQVVLGAVREAVDSARGRRRRNCRHRSPPKSSRAGSPSSGSAWSSPTCSA